MKVHTTDDGAVPTASRYAVTDGNNRLAEYNSRFWAFQYCEDVNRYCKDANMKVVAINLA